MNEFYQYPALSALSSQLGLEALRNNNSKGIPNRCILTGPDGAGKHYFLEQTIRPMFTAGKQLAPDFDVLNYQITKSGEVKSSVWGNKSHTYVIKQGFTTILEKLVFNSSISLLNGIISLPSIADIFPGLNSKKQNCLIIIENEYQNTSLTKWLIDHIANNTENSHYLLVLTNLPTLLEKKLKEDSDWRLCYTPTITEKNVSSIQCTTDPSKKIDAQIEHAASLIHVTSAELINQLGSRPGLLFDLIRRNDSFNLQKLFQPIEIATKSQDNKTNRAKLWLSVLDDGATKNDLMKLIGDKKADKVLIALTKARLIDTSTKSNYKLSAILKYYLQEHPINATKSDVCLLDDIVKERVPWNYALRAAIADKEEHSDIHANHDNIFRTIDKLQTGEYKVNEGSNHILNVALQMRAATVDTQNSVSSSLRQSSFQLLTYTKSPLLRTQLYVILIQFAKRIRVESLLTVAIVKTISAYDELVELNEYDMMFNLGLELAPDILNYNLDKYKLEANKMFSSMHSLLDNPEIKWPKEIQKMLLISLVQHEGVFNSSETQRIQLEGIKTLLDPTDVSEKLRTLTNLVGIDMCSAIKKSKSDQLQYLGELKNVLDAEKNIYDYKALNNYVLGEYLLGNITARKAQDYFLKHCYSGKSLTQVALSPIPTTSHKIIHINLAMLAVETNEKNINAALTMLTIALSNAPQDDFYQFYVGYNRLMLRYQKGSISKTSLKEQLLVLKIPNLFADLESGDMLYRRLDYLEQLLEGNQVDNYMSLKKAYLKQAQNPIWHRSLLSHQLSLYSDLQHWD
ncbi:hypothetical protein EQK45_04985 [Lactiplantibacillus plantarum]|uniref:hypothetical protein n=1 Tax=Lactiplantibacillus plantarum TaxID=1590 RepID=UPI000FF8BABB|nr:hypothetical protein [Lactiplantibacillus plantarum]QAS29393.1 hypothetical protein EQK45_04985 [Lactiplantibacillus plantarum]